MKERNFQDYYKILKRDLTKYVELKAELYGLNFIESFSLLVTKFVTLSITFLFGIVFTMFLLLTLAYFLGDLLGATYLGFLIVSGIFLILAVIFIALRHKFLTNPIINAMISVMFKYDKDDEDNASKEK